MLLYKNILVLSFKSAFIPTLLHEFHTTPSSGHLGFLRTYNRLVANLFWFRMKKMVQQFVRGCDTCQRNKYVVTSSTSICTKTNMGGYFDYFITRLPRSKGHETIFVVVDRLSKYAHFICLNTCILLKALLPYLLRKSFYYMAFLCPFSVIGIQTLSVYFGESYLNYVAPPLR